MEWQSTLAEWTAASEAVGQELVGWRQAHPRATLAEIEAAVQAALSRLQGRYLQDLAQASARGPEHRDGGRTAGLPGVWRRLGGAWAAGTGGADAAPRGGAAVAAQLCGLLGLRDRAFPPWMRNYSCWRVG